MAPVEAAAGTLAIHVIAPVAAVAGTPAIPNTATVEVSLEYK